MRRTEPSKPYPVQNSHRLRQPSPGFGQSPWRSLGRRKSAGDESGTGLASRTGPFCTGRGADATGRRVGHPHVAPQVVATPIGGLQDGPLEPGSEMGSLASGRIAAWLARLTPGQRPREIRGNTHCLRSQSGADGLPQVGATMYSCGSSSARCAQADRFSRRL